MEDGDGDYYFVRWPATHSLYFSIDTNLCKILSVTIITSFDFLSSSKTRRIFSSRLRLVIVSSDNWSIRDYSSSHRKFSVWGDPIGAFYTVIVTFKPLLKPSELNMFIKVSLSSFSKINLELNVDCDSVLPYNSSSILFYSAKKDFHLTTFLNLFRLIKVYENLTSISCLYIFTWGLTSDM